VKEQPPKMWQFITWCGGRKYLLANQILWWATILRVAGLLSGWEWVSAISIVGGWYGYANVKRAVQTFHKPVAGEEQ
jgi:hypothetical protein